MKTREDGNLNDCKHKRIMQHHVPVHTSVVVLTGTINNPSYPQSMLRLEVLTAGYMEEQGFVPAQSTSLHLTLPQLDMLIADLQEQRLRMLPKENS